MNWLDRAVLAGGFENAFHRHFQRPAPANPDSVLLRTYSGVETSGRNRTSGARRSSIKMAVSSRKRRTEHICERVFFYYFILTISESATFPQFAVYAELLRRNEMNRWISDEREHSCENPREYLERTGAVFQTQFHPNVRVKLHARNKSDLPICLPILILQSLL